MITFFVIVFLLDMQLLFRYVKDFAGKGLDMLTMLEFLGYASLSLVPLAMPISILLSSIMAFGNLGEQYELAALKASGISLLWVLRPLSIVVLVISFGMHFYMEDALPTINFHLLNMQANMVRKNAAVQLRPGIFDSAIPGYYIRVGNKSGPQKNILHDIFIKKEGTFYSNQETITAKNGKILNSPSPNYLIMALEDGTIYRDEIQGKSDAERARQPMNSVHFHKLIQYIDISFITQIDLNKTISATDRKMLNSEKLRKFSDSFFIIKSKEVATYTKNALQSAIPSRARSQIDSVIQLAPPSLKSLSGVLTGRADTDQRIASEALDRAQKKLNARIQQQNWMDWRTKQIGQFNIELQRKWSFSIACLLLFFIGAPLGSIIRKGGFGVPFLAAVIVFVLYYVLYIIGENMTTRGRWNPLLGGWFNAMVLLPLGVYLTYRATVDATLFSPAYPFKAMKKLANRIKKSISLKRKA